MAWCVVAHTVLLQPGGVLDTQQQLPELNDCSTGEDAQVLPIWNYFFCPKRLIMERRMLHPPVKAAHKTEAGGRRAETSIL